jgi:hypothetical protein
MLVALVFAPFARTAAPLAVRPAVPADDSPKLPVDDLSMPRGTEWWHVLLFHPPSRSYVHVMAMSRPWGDFELSIIERRAVTMGISIRSMGVVPQSSPGVTMAGTATPPPTEPPRASISYTGGRYVVDVAAGVEGAHLEIVPQRVGPTVGPWRLAPLQTGWNPPSFIPGTRMWTVPVAAGTASGWVQADGRRLTLSGWRAYHDHTWGSFSLAAPSWYHSDFAVVSPRPGEAWILNGLQPGDNKYRPEPNDRGWQGVLVHATRSRVVTCAARVRRSGWVRATRISDGWHYHLPNRVQASCARAGSFVFRPAGGFRGLSLLGFGLPPAHEVGADTETPGGTGWIAHAMPPVPNS